MRNYRKNYYGNVVKLNVISAQTMLLLMQSYVFLYMYNNWKKKIFTNISTARCTILTEFEPEKQINKYSHVKSSNPTL